MISPAVHTGPSQLDQALAAEGGRSPKASQAGLPAASTPGAHLGHSKYEVAQVIQNRASGVMSRVGQAACSTCQAGVSPPPCKTLLWRMRCQMGPLLRQVLIPKGSVFMLMLFKTWMLKLSWSVTPVPSFWQVLLCWLPCQVQAGSAWHQHNANSQTDLLHCLHGRASSAGRGKHSPEQNQAAA